MARTYYRYRCETCPLQPMILPQDSESVDPAEHEQAGMDHLEANPSHLMSALIAYDPNYEAPAP